MVVVGERRPRLLGVLLLAVALGIGPAGPAAGQDAPAGEAPGDGDPLARPRYMLYLFDTEEDAFTEREEFLLYNALLTETAAATDAVVILESPDPEVPDDQLAWESLARSINADSWLRVVASGGFENLTVEVESYDLLRRELVADEVIRPGFVVDYRIIAAGIFSDVAGMLAENYERIVDTTELTVEALPGTAVSGLPGGTREVDGSGALTVSVPASSAYGLTAALPGHYTVDEELFLGVDPQTVNLEQVARPQFGLDLRIASLQFPGMRFWYYLPLPVDLFARTGFTTQAIGLYPIDNTSRLVQAGSSLSSWSIDAGGYLTAPREFLRLYAGAGGFLRFVGLSLSELSLEQDAAAGAFTLFLGAEYSQSRRFRLFFEYEPAYIFADDPGRFIDVTFLRNRFPSDNPPGFVVLDSAVVDLRNLYVGARWDF
ncbi:MAG: hypothetical protein ACOC47_00985 [Alkalispirochaetaceae bacterium]